MFNILLTTTKSKLHYVGHLELAPFIQTKPCCLSFIMLVLSSLKQILFFQQEIQKLCCTCKMKNPKYKCNRTYMLPKSFKPPLSLYIDSFYMYSTVVIFKTPNIYYELDRVK